MVVTTVRFQEDVYKEAKELASFNGENITTFIRKAVEEKIENEQDYEDCVNAVKSMKKTISREEVMKAVFNDERQ